MLKLLLCLVLCCVLRGVAGASCDLGQFECPNENENGTICISKLEQCDKRDDCGDASDESNCTVVRYCGLDKLECADSTDAGNTLCLDPAKGVCMANLLEADPLCAKAEDKVNCRCDTNQKGSKPLRCPTDGKCYASTKETDFCVGCPDALNCQMPDNVTECGAQAGYFSCRTIMALAQYRCFPEAALCDGYQNCDDGTDSVPCVGAAVTLLTEKQPDLYLGNDYAIQYEIVGRPLPQYTLYHYHKELSLPIISKTFNITTELIEKTDSDNTYTLTIHFTNLNLVNYGDYDLVVFNVPGVTVDGTTNTGYHHRAKANTVYIHYDGAPETQLEGVAEGGATLLVVATEQYELQCKVAADPEPHVTFFIDGEAIPESEEVESNYTITKSDYTNKELVVTLSFKPAYEAHNGKVFKCSAQNVLGDDFSQEATLDVMVPARISRVFFSDNAVAKGYKVYSKVNEQVEMNCVAGGDPLPTVSWFRGVDEIAITGNTANNEITVGKNVTNDATTTYTCKASNQKQIRQTTDSRDITLIPIARPEISMAKTSYVELAGEQVNISIQITAVKEGRNISVYEATSGNPITDPWIYNCTENETDENVVTCDVSTAAVVYQDVSYNMTLVAETLFDLFKSQESFTVKVLAKIAFTKELEAELSVYVNTTQTLSVEVSGDPVPTSYEWFRNDVSIANENGPNYTMEKMQEADSATYKVVVTQTLPPYGSVTESSTVTIESSTVLKVTDNPCLDDPPPCKNDGNCSHVGTVVSCACQVGFSGDRCATNEWCTKHTPCVTENAQAACQELNYPDNYYCNCTFGFQNKNCSEETDFCKNEGGAAACGQGICENNRNNPPEGFDCYCKHTEGGVYCNLTQLCTPNPCKNDGTCKVVGYGDEAERTCVCSEGYEGDTCEKEVDGYCFAGGCNKRGLCYEANSNLCMCEYPYYGTDCSDEVPTDDILQISATGHLENTVAQDAVMLADHVTQKFILPVSVLTDSGSLLVLLNKETFDSVKLTMENGNLAVKAQCGDQGAVWLDLDDEPIKIGPPLTITVVLQYNKLGITVTEYHNGTTIAGGVELAGECAPLNTIHIGDPVERNADAEGVSLVLWDHLNAGQTVVSRYVSGRSVAPAEPCAVDLCRNGGNCTLPDGTCTCHDGFSGPLCENVEDTVCARAECLNNGYCEVGYCHCPLGFYGTMCQSRLTDTSTVTLREASSFALYTAAEPIVTLELKLHAQFGGVELGKALGQDLLTVGNLANNIKLRLGYDEFLYLVVTRGSKTGVYDGLGTAADLCDCGLGTSPDTCYTAIKLTVEQDILLNITRHYEGVPAVSKQIAVQDDELPCPDGLPLLKTVLVTGLMVSGPVHVYSLQVNAGNSSVSLDSGMNLLTQTEGDACAGSCSGGSCETHGNMARCADCPSETDPNTCLAPECDAGTCTGTCSSTVGCVCDFHVQGKNCDEKLVIGENRVAKTKTSYHSWMKYQSSNAEAGSFFIEFMVKVEGPTQHGQLMFVGDAGQYVSMYLVGTTLKVHSHCSATNDHVASTEGVAYDTWQKVYYTWRAKYVSVRINNDTLISHSVSLCAWKSDGAVYFGGVPDNIMSPASLILAVADVNFDLNPLSHPIGGSNLELALDHVCDIPPGPCDPVGTASCVSKTDYSYTCSCAEGYAGAWCERVKVACDDLQCAENQECVMGKCICIDPYDQSDPNCQTRLDNLIGVQCLPEGHLTLQFDSAQYTNGFDLRFQVKIAAATVNGTYNLLTMVLNTGDVISMDVSIEADASNDTNTTSSENDTGYHGEAVSEEKKLLTKIKVENLGLEFDNVSEGWLRIIIYIGSGGYSVTVAEKTRSNFEYYSAFNPVSARFGHYNLAGYTGCLGHVQLNGAPLSRLSAVGNGAGLSTCTEEVISEGDEGTFGSADLWTKAGIL